MQVNKRSVLLQLFILTLNGRRNTNGKNCAYKPHIFRIDCCRLRCPVCMAFDCTADSIFHNLHRMHCVRSRIQWSARDNKQWIINHRTQCRCNIELLHVNCRMREVIMTLSRASMLIIVFAFIFIDYKLSLYINHCNSIDFQLRSQSIHLYL